MIFDGALDEFGGVTLHKLSPRVDAGDIVAQRHVRRSAYRNVMAWDLAMADAGYDFVRNELPAHLRGQLPAIQQDENEASYDPLPAEETFITADWPYWKIRAVLDQGYGIYGFTFAKVTMPGREDRLIALYPDMHRIGDVTGEPPVILNASIEMDVHDCRLRIARETRWKRYVNKVERYRTLLASR